MTFNSYIRPQDRWASENTETKMPTWMIDMIIIDGASPINPAREEKSNTQLRCEIDRWKRRALFEKARQDEQIRDLTSKLAGKKRKHDEICNANEAEKRMLKERACKAEERVKKLEKRLDRARETIEMLQKEKASPLRYDDLYEGRLLANHVEAFTLFDTVAQNDAFLELINYADGTEGGESAFDLL